MGNSLQLSALASEPVIVSGREATLETAAKLATRIKQPSVPQGETDGAENSAPHETTESAFNFPQNFVPPGDGRPDHTRGSGARPVGGCATATGLEVEADAQKIYPLIPSERYGLTFQSHPSIFIDFDGDSAPTVFLRVESESGDYSELATLPVVPEQSIQGFALPSDRPPLEIGKNYLWTLMVACDGNIKPDHPLFTGWVQRVAQTPEMAEQLASQSISEQVAWYADQGYWYDIVARLYGSIQAGSEDNTVAVLWEQVLTFVDESE